MTPMTNISRNFENKTKKKVKQFGQTARLGGSPGRYFIILTAFGLLSVYCSIVRKKKNNTPDKHSWFLSLCKYKIWLVSGTWSLVCHQPGNMIRTNCQPIQCFGLGRVQRPLPSLDSPCLLVCPVLCAALWCLSVLTPEAQCERDFSFYIPSSSSSPFSPFYSWTNVPVYRWDVDDNVDKKNLYILHF